MTAIGTTDLDDTSNDDLISHNDYKQFVCKETLKAVDHAGRIFAATHIFFQVISVILAAAVTILHHLKWTNSETVGVAIGVVHTVTLVIFTLIQPQKAHAELLHMKSLGMSYSTTKAQMPVHILNDMMKVNTWCVSHPFIANECKGEIEQLKNTVTKSQITL